VSFANVPSGIAWYVGAPQQGKTTLALRHVRELVERTGKPCITLDLGSVTQFKDIYHEANVHDLIDAVWGGGDHVVYSPASIPEIDRLAKAISRAGECIVLIDEAIYALNGKGACSQGLLAVMRAHAHCNVHFLLTTQHFSGDLPAAARSMSPWIYLFRVSKSAIPTLDYLETYHGIERERVTSLKVGEFIELDPSSV